MAEKSRAGEEVLPVDPEALKDYLAAIDGLERYVVAFEGLPMYWKGISQAEAEELVATASDIAANAARHGGERGEQVIALIEVGDESLAILSHRELTIVVAGNTEAAQGALRNIASKLQGRGHACPWCGGDLALTPVKCPSCGKSIPFGLERCPHCGAKISYVKCPHCGRLVSPRGRRVVLKRRGSDLVLGASLAPIGAGLLASSALLAADPMGRIVLTVTGGAILAVSAVTALYAPRRPVEEESTSGKRGSKS